MDLREEWSGRKPERPRTVFWRYKRAENRRKAVRHGNWKYVWENGQESLHDLAVDPCEKVNLSTANPSETEMMRKHMAEWEKEVAAPRLKDFRPSAG
jgi:hypothetical protein